MTIPSPARSGSKLVGTQLAIALLVLIGAAFIPPSHGPMLLVPLFPGAAAGMIARATDDGALLLGRGPIAGSMVVRGDRATMVRAMLGHGVLVMAAPATSCGASEGRQA